MVGALRDCIISDTVAKRFLKKEFEDEDEVRQLITSVIAKLDFRRGRACF